MAIHESEINEIASKANNPQDGVIVALGFDGLSFNDGCREFLHLTKSHVDFENRLINVNGFMLSKSNPMPRQVPICQTTKILIEQALNQRVYINNEGEKEKLAESEYVLRDIYNNAHVNWEEIHQRIARVAKETDNEYLNATTISYSGRLYYTKQLLDGGMELDAAVVVILQRFGVEDNSSSRDYLVKRVLMDLNEGEVPISQEYFWTKEWQEKMEESQKSLEEGYVEVFNSVDELLRDLDNDKDDK